MANFPRVCTYARSYPSMGATGRGTGEAGADGLRARPAHQRHQRKKSSSVDGLVQAKDADPPHDTESVASSDTESEDESVDEFTFTPRHSFHGLSKEYAC